MQLRKIEAYVRRERLSFILMGLDKLPKFPGITVLDCQGFGNEHQPKTHARIVEYLLEPFRHAKLEIFCPEDEMGRIIGVVKEQSGTKEGSHVRIFVSELGEFEEVKR